MDPIYVTGHRNPDTDSIVAALAYAALRNACGDREYEAACLGRVSDETEMVLKKFGFQPPKRINNMYTQVKDLDFDTPPFLSTAVTVSRAWKIMQQQKSGTIINISSVCALYAWPAWSVYTAAKAGLAKFVPDQPSSTNTLIFLNPFSFAYFSSIDFWFVIELLSPCSSSSRDSLQ